MPQQDDESQKVVISQQALNELGTTGLKRTAGQVSEDYIPKLRGLRRRMKVYDEMVHDSTIAAVLFAIELYVRRTEFKFKACDDSAESKAAAEFLNECMHDMQHSWQDFLSEALSMIPYGFSVHEVVYKLREDGRIGWHKIPVRAQSTIDAWDFDDSGEVRGFWQMDPYTATYAYIPMQKALLFRPATTKGNPEGRSALRSCYTPWYFKKKLEVIEAIGIERDLTGYPVLKAPVDLFSDSESAKKLRQYASDVVTRIRKDAQMGAVLPPEWELELIASPGRSQVDTSEVIGRYDLRIAQAVLADVIMLGHSGSGSFALAESKQQLFFGALEAWLDTISEIFTRYAVPRMLELNGLPGEARLAHGPVTRIDPQKLSNVLFRLSGVDMVRPDHELEKYLRDFLGLPEPEGDRTGEEDENENEDSNSNSNSNSDLDRQLSGRPDNMTRPASVDGSFDQKK